MNWSSAPIPVPEQRLLSLAEVSVAIGYHEKTIKRWIRDGKFPVARRIGDGWKWTAMSIGVWLAWQDHCPPAEKATENEDGVKGN